jgi:hypothetical protein
MSCESLKIESAGGDYKPQPDKRPHMPEPPPVRLTAVEDVHAPAPFGLAPQLDAFYVQLLRFEREPAEAALTYRADNFRLHFDITEQPLEREDFRPILIEVPRLGEVELQLVEREIEYERHRGLTPGQDQLILRDPAGNWVALSEMHELR